MTQNLFQVSGLNSRFIGAQPSFSDYIQRMQDIILAAHPHTEANRQRILEMNSPFEWYPEGSSAWQPPKRGILLLHGLYTSPYMFHTMARRLVRQGFLVRTLLLPGHGTVPGDLLEIRHQEWINAVSYGISSLQEVIDEIYVGGFSLGATLALHAAASGAAVKGLILLAPALKAQSSYAFLVDWHTIISWALSAAKWYRRGPQICLDKYESLPMNAAVQARQLMQKTCKLLENPAFKTPFFVAASADDEVVSCKAILKFFQKAQSEPKRMLLYSACNDSPPAGILARPSSFPEQKIVNFSHICLPFPPDDPVYGQHSGYQDFHHYPNSQPPTNNVTLQGSVSLKNLKAGTLQRLTYNPDFDFMMTEIDRFMADLETGAYQVEMMNGEEFQN